MKKPRIMKDFLRFGDAKLETFTGYVLSCMNNNPYFLQPLPSLADVSTTHQQYMASLSAAQSRDRSHVAQKNDLKEKLKAQLDQLADYVTLTANGSRPVLVSSGFTVSSEVTGGTAPLGVIGTPDVALGKNSGEADVSVAPVENARYYIYYYALDAENPVWLHVSDTVSSTTITGLTPLKTWLFRVTAKGVKGQSSDSGEVAKAIV